MSWVSSTVTLTHCTMCELAGGCAFDALVRRPRRAKKSAKGGEGGLGRLGILDGVEVVDVVAAGDEQHGA